MLALVPIVSYNPGLLMARALQASQLLYLISGLDPPSKISPRIYATVRAVMFGKKHRRSSSAQEEGLTNEGRQHLLLLQVHHCMRT